MADRYFIGTGNRNLMDVANWSLTSGGVPYQPVSGTEKINPDMSNVSLQPGWSTSLGVLYSDPAYSAYILGSFTSGKYYKITFNLNAVSGIVRIYNSHWGIPVTIDLSISGTYTLYGQHIGVGHILRSFSFTGSISGLSIQEVDDIAPTSAINAIFDSNSGTGTITVNANFNCLNLTFTNIQPITISGSVFTLSVYGNLTLPATNLTWTFTGTSYLYLKATTSVNITMGATTGRSFNRLYFDGVGGTWTNQDELSTSAVIYLQNGTWNTSDKSITSGSFSLVGTASKTLNAGNSVLNFTALAFSSSVGAVLNFQTSTVIVTGGTMTGGSNTSSFFNLTFLMNPSITSNANFYVNIIVNNNLVITGNNSTNFRGIIKSAYVGTPMTITCNGAILASNVDFMDITLAGTANRDLSAIAGGSGDCGGNSGITFTTSQTQYHYRPTAGGSNWNTAGLWFTGSNGTGVSGRVPLPQDDVIFDANSFPAGAGNTLYVNCPRIGRSLDMSGVDVALPMTIANMVECYGSFVLGENITPSGSNMVTLMGRGQFIFNSYVKTLYAVHITAIGGVYTNHSNIVLANAFWVNNGTFDINDFDSLIGGLVRTKLTGTILYMGNGTMSLSFTGNDHGFLGEIYAELSIIKLVPTGTGFCQFRCTVGNVFNKIWVSGNSTNYTDMGGFTVQELIVNAGRIVKFLATTTSTINKLTAIGVEGNLITIDSTALAAYNLNVIGTIQNVDYVDFKYCNVVQQNKLFAGVNSVNSGNNVNVVFGAIGAASEAIPFTEIEILESTLLGQVGITPALTEAETFNGICQASAFLPVAFTEAETLVAALIARIALLPAFTEAETMDGADIAARQFIEANFTEEEKMLLLGFEKITGPLVFSQIITGTLKFL